MKVSLIMSCYNCIEHFRASMECALRQDYPDLEFVVVDGGSTDGTAELILEYAARIEVMSAGAGANGEGGAALHRTMRWVSEPDHGIYDAMNKGIRMASGDVLAVYNDLFTRTDAVSMLVAAMERDHADGVHADLIYADGDVCKRLWQMGDGGMRVRNVAGSSTAVARDGHDAETTREQSAACVSYPQIHTGWMPAHPTLYLRREVYERFGEYDTAMRSSADYDYMLRILTGEHAIRLAYVPEVLIQMFYGGTSNAGISGYTRNIREAYRALRQNHVSWPLIAILSRTVRTLSQYRRASQYGESMVE